MRAVAALVAVLAAAPASGQDGTLDPGAPDGAARTVHREAERDAYDLPVGRFTRERRPVRPLEGRVSRSAYRIDGADASVAGAIDWYRRELAGLGYAPIFECRTRTCGGFDFRFGAELVPAPEMLIDTADFAQLTMQGPDDRFASILASRVLGAVYVQAVMVEADPAAEPAAMPDPPAPQSSGSAASPPKATDSAQETVSEELNADARTGDEPPSLADELRRAGHVVLDGLAFEPGGARLSEGSAAALDRAAEMLGENAGMKLAIVGHSDNVGGYEPNLALSRRRAEAVRDALVARGVAADRLEAEGVAWLSPVASNETEEGRRRNRRVELVLK